MRRIGGYLLLATGFLACPCHLPFALPLLAAVLGGTTIGASLLDNTGLLVALLGGYFILALLVGFRLLSGPARGGSGVACETCADEDERTAPQPEKAVEPRWRDDATPAGAHTHTGGTR